MTAIKTQAPNIPGTPAAAPQIYVTGPAGNLLVVQHVPGLPAGSGNDPLIPFQSGALISIGPVGQNAVVLSQSNITDLLASLTSFSTSGVLS